MVNKIELIFVYNINSSPFSQAIDFFKLVKSPQTFKCNLYKIIHDSFLIKKEWEIFMKKSSFNIRYLYNDEFYKKYPDDKLGSPSILMNHKGRITTFVSTDEINGMLSHTDLIKTITNKIMQPLQSQ